ncbi:hypothetical protein BOX15_Mlig024319g2 [Macrostomum lignano]|uniref:Nuclear pore protein n=2 Tax=Macrostomum lignano TaxID=282301 RepID=A0A267EKL6_9PLAT|nr:hypothetical protein BOX15_Mlig024319g2 [Macrostomum lignano]
MTQTLEQLLEEAEGLVTQLQGDADLPQLSRTLPQLRSLGSRLAAARPPPSQDSELAAAQFLASHGVSAPQLPRQLDALSALSGYDNLEATAPTDVPAFLRNERQNALLTAVEHSRARTARDWDARSRRLQRADWEAEKAALLSCLAGASAFDLPDSLAPTRDRLTSAGGGGAALSDSILASAPGSAIAGGSGGGGSGVLLTAVEQTYAGALESHTQAALDRGDPGPDLCAAMRHAVAGKLGDPALVDFWALIDRVGSARRGAHGSLREARAAPAFQRAAARLALEHLEASYAAFVRQAVAKEPARARLGGVPGNRALIRAFAGLPRPPAGLLEDGQVDGRPVWAVIYFHMRCGFLNDALTVAKDAAAVLGDFPAALEEYVANDRQLAAETEARLASQLRRAVDPYRRLLICLMARCDVADCHADVATSVEDFLWLRLSQIAWDGRSDRLSLGALQRQLAEEYGEAHFSAWQQPLLFFSVLFLTQQWELALAFLSRSEPLRCHAVHAALAMHDRRLLLLAESPDAPLTSRLDGGLVALNLCRLVQLYSRRLETSRPLDALNLLHCLRPGAAFRAAAAELVSASRQFDLLLGRVDPDTGVRRRGAVQRFGLDASELAAGVAEASESAGRLEEAACLFELAGRWDRTLGPLCRLLSACIAQPPAAPDRRRTLEFAAAAAARLRRAGPSEEARAPLAGTLYRLLDLSTYFTMFYEGRHSAALQLLDHLRLLPARLDAVDARVRAFEASGSDELRRCLPDLLLTCMRLLQLLHRAAVEAAARPGSGGGLSSAEPAPPAAAEMRERAQALVAFAGKLPFRLPSSVYARLTQLEVQIV